MAAWRLFRLALHVMAGLFISAAVFPLIGPASRDSIVRRWSAQLLALLGVRIRLMDEGVPLHGLVVCNHVSWLDIFVINSLQPCRFVAKSDIRSWPVIGWLCAKTGTIFIERGRVRDVRRIFVGLVEAIRGGESVAFFPEGTTAAQGGMLPFHANLFEAAIDAGAPVQPCAIRYVDGDGRFHQAAEFIGETTLAQSLMAIARARGMIAELSVLPAVPAANAHRRELAVAARESIAAALLPQPGA